MTIGISKENDEEYKLVLQIPITTKVSTKSRIVTEEGESVSSALGQMRTHTEKAIDYTQIRLIIIQNNLAKNEEQFSNLLSP
ncbi:Ger(x)C family spore germination protein [Gordoniibacillus kamchatkensis]|uniref:Ger(x)C family spore germination protein n=1 Tax=Gordoniibacillus kamchatkensis TaxID=1590651 RepID=UPI0012DFF349|nr:hypothetical protein [Paenibacillus sp. VKM B-2647]